MIREQVKLVDVVIELLDARIPVSSANPVVADLVGSKPRLIVLNKADLAEPAVTRQWVEYFSRRNIPALTLNAVTGEGTKELVKRVEQLASDRINALIAKGIRPRPVRAMIVGIPNVGKSSLVNRLLGVAKTRTGNKPGVTRGQQWLKIGRNLELLDTPGILWPKQDDQEVAFKLAVTGAINDDVYVLEDVIMRLLNILRAKYPNRLQARYNLPDPLPQDNETLLALIGERRGCLRAGGAVDYEKVGRIILTELRAGKLGPFTLDDIPEE